MMNWFKRYIVAGSFLLLLSFPNASAQETAEEMIQDYLDFATYEAGIIMPAQLTEDVFHDFVFIDTRDEEQFETETIPGAINIEWREILLNKDELPEGQKLVLFCNTGTLSAQAMLALRLVGNENALALQTGIKGWLADAPYKPVN